MSSGYGHIRPSEYTGDYATRQMDQGQVPPQAGYGRHDWQYQAQPPLHRPPPSHHAHGLPPTPQQQQQQRQHRYMSQASLNSFPQSMQHSSDPLQYYQQPPQAYTVPPVQPFTPQPVQFFPQPAIQHRHHQSSSRQAHHSSQWPKNPTFSPPQPNASSSTRDAQHPQRNHAAQQQQQHALYQQRPLSPAGSSLTSFHHPSQTRQRPHLASAQPPALVQQTLPQPGQATTPTPLLSQAQQQIPPQRPAPKMELEPRHDQQASPQLQEGLASRPQHSLAPAQMSNVALQSAHQQVSSRQDSRSEPTLSTNPDVAQRSVAFVAVPVQRASAKGKQPSVARSPKRRKSNHGETLPVCNPQPAPRLQSSSKLPKKATLPSSSLGGVSTSKIPPIPTCADIDYQTVLLGLSDEYISAAYNMSPGLAAADRSEVDLDQYHSLLSTGMSCLDSILKNYHISDPRKEARIRLRLASLLYEETDNDTEAEEVLTKGLLICERSRLSDLKYAMHHLLARLWSKSGKSKAAMKAVEKHIGEVEKLNLLHWVYAFRFLRVSLGIRAGNTIAEMVALVKQLSAISEIASRHQNDAVQFVASALEALVHLRSRTPDSTDLAQRALALSRAHQLSPELELLPQAIVLVDCLDLGSSLAQFKREQVATKMRAMQANMEALAEPAWKEDASWTVPVWTPSSCSTHIEGDSASVFKALGNGQYALTFRWLTRKQVHTLGYLLSGLACMHKNASHDQNSETFLKEGLKLADGALEPIQQSMAAASTLDTHQKLTRIIISLYRVFAACGRADWSQSLKDISNIRKDLTDLEEEADEGVLSLTSYLEAIAEHGKGDLQRALRLYRTPELRLDPDDEPKPSPANVRPIRVLAALNSILIMRHLGEGPAAEVLLYHLKPYCLTGTNSNGSEYGSKALESVFYILQASNPNDTPEETPIIRTKTFLQSAVFAAKAAVNSQLLCVVMNVMTDTFFRNIVGEQAEKSARAGRVLAQRSKDTLWTAVSDGMYMDTLERCGKKEEAQQAKQEAHEALQRLPDSLKVTLLGERMYK